MYCHRCATKQAIDAGVYAGVPYEQLPCAACKLEENSTGTIAFDEAREDAKVREGLGIPETPPVEELPVSVLGDALKLFLGLSDDELAIVRGKWAGKCYAELAAERRVTPQAVEIRLRRLLEATPLLGCLFVQKLKRRQARQKLKVSSRKGEVVTASQQTATA
jgi:hypothetical protein